jgi:hypothetical protein
MLNHAYLRISLILEKRSETWKIKEVSLRGYFCVMSDSPYELVLDLDLL